MTFSSYLTYTAFTLTCLVLLTLPFIPAFREWLNPTDSAALPILSNYSSDIDYFAKRFHGDVMAKLGLGAPTGYEDFDFVVDWVEDMDWGNARKRLISESSIESPSPIQSDQALYVKGNLCAGAASAFSRLYVTGDIDLGAGSEIHDWAYVNGVLRLGANSVALRRVSAGTAIELNKETWFERLQAPTLHFGSRHGKVTSSVEVEQVEASFAELPRAVEKTPSLFVIQGDCVLPAGMIYRGSLVVTGFLTIGSGSTVIGDIKAREGVCIGAHAWVKGAVTCEKRVYIFNHARALGPVVSESDILIGTETVIGLPGAQTTVCAKNIIVEVGAVVHGTVWAHEIGMVKAA